MHTCTYEILAVENWSQYLLPHQFFVSFSKTHLNTLILFCSYPVLPNQASSILHDCEDEEGAEEFLLSNEVESEGEEEVEGEMEDNEFMEAEQRRFDAQLPMLVLPLYSLLSAEQQAKVIPF